MTTDSLTVAAELIEQRGGGGHYTVTATLTVTAESLAQAVGAVAEALGDLA